MKKALSYLLIFIGIQLLGGAIIQTVWSLVTHSSDKTAAMLITLTAICAVLVITVFLWARFTVVSPKWLRTRPWTVLAWSVMASLGALIPSIWMQEQMPELPNLMENEFDTISEGVAEVTETIRLGSHSHIGSNVCPHPYESSPDASCLYHRIVAGMDVLAHRVDTARSSLSLVKQQCSICDVRPLSQS